MKIYRGLQAHEENAQHHLVIGKYKSKSQRDNTTR